MLNSIRLNNLDGLDGKIAIATALMILLSILAPAAAAPPEDKRVNVIIGFKDKPDRLMIETHGGKIKYEYDIVPAIAANIPVQAIDRLTNNPNIAYIEEDFEMHESEEVLTWGVDRIDADRVWGTGVAPETISGANTGAGVKVAVIDSGIDKDHPDLAANIKGGINYVKYDGILDPTKWDDDRGHGTHVAGIIGAIDNDIGVIGVAPQAHLYAVKVINKDGTGYTSDVVAGIEWAAKNNMDIISMSLSGPDTETKKAACDKAYAAGIVLVAAAGNGYGEPVKYPAAYESVIAVSATTSDDKIADYSNIGQQIELAAPGSSIYSTYIGGGYSTKSGTSMATPHVTGTVALVLATNVSEIYDYNRNGKWDPLEVRQRLHDTAIDLGTSGKDDYYGYGLVNALAAAGASTISPPDPSPPADELHVAGILMATGKISKGKNVFNYATATVLLVNSTGIPVPDATVSGHWSGLTTDSDSGATDGSGMVTLQSDSTKKSGMFTFTVDNIVHPSIGYNTSANVVYNGSVSVLSTAR